MASLADKVWVGVQVGHGGALASEVTPVKASAVIVLINKEVGLNPAFTGQDAWAMDAFACMVSQVCAVLNSSLVVCVVELSCDGILHSLLGLWVVWGYV